MPLLESAARLLGSPARTRVALGGTRGSIATAMGAAVTSPTHEFNMTLPRALVLAAALCLIGGRHRLAPLPTVTSVDLARYAGTWHEIARLPNIFQATCDRSWARYEPRPDGSLAITNSCTTRRGRCREATGTAEPVPCSGNARLRVRFDGFAALMPVPRDGNYWIIALDDDYCWAMIGTPDRRFLWILARDTCLDRDVYAGLVAQARCLGFAVDRLITR